MKGHGSAMGVKVSTGQEIRPTQLTAGARVELFFPSDVRAAARDAMNCLNSLWDAVQGERSGAVLVVEHHPRQGDSAIRMIGFDRVAADNPDIGQILGLPEAGELPLVRPEPVVPLAELVDLWDGTTFQRLPTCHRGDGEVPHQSPIRTLPHRWIPTGWGPR
jgi:hypothetical protein